MTGKSLRWVSSTFCLVSAVYAAPVFAQTPSVITDVRIEQEGRPVDDRLIVRLIETTVGEQLSMQEVRETLSHLTSLNRFEDVRVFQEPTPGGIRLRYVLFPLHPVDRIEFRGALGLPEREIRRVITERFGAAPAATRLDAMMEALRGVYAERGFPAARITPRLEETHQPDRATMVFDIIAGGRATIGRLEVDEIDATDRRVTPGDLGIRAGDPYDNDAIVEALERYAGALRARGFYEARAVHTPTFEADGTATVRVTIDRGPLVTVAFAGDPLPEADRDRLVPVRAEGSVDEDLLEDATFAIEEYLHARGYRDAAVEYARAESEGTLTITFTVMRGARYVIENMAIGGNVSLPVAELERLVPIKAGQPYVQAAATAAATALRDAYRARGFTRTTVQIAVTELDPAGGADRPVTVRFNITEGPRTVVSSIAFEGNGVLQDAELHSLMTTAPGRPYSEADIVTARDRIDLEYRNRGYENVVVNPAVALADNGTRADIRFDIAEGPQVIVDDVIIIGNQRTSTETIERELLLRPGQPLGLSARIESQQRLAALGLFRRVVIEELQQGGEPRRDVLVQVEEAPPTTIDYGGGVEGGMRLRPTGESGRAEERFELAPRGFFQVGRRNLGGKNRAVNLFTRVSLRSRDNIVSDGLRGSDPPVGPGGQTPDRAVEGSYGFNEYRVLATYREPRAFSSPADVMVTGILDQAIRSSFNFITREARAEAGLRLGPRYTVAGRYSYEHTRLFNERFTDREKPLIDRVFPQVRLSKFSGTLIRDSRNDVIDADRGTFLITDTELAVRSIGSEVGFVKTFVQGFTYHRLPTDRRMVLALGARVGAAHGFRRPVPRIAPDGQPILDAEGQPIVDVVQDLPASERFFAGGDTTVRGFSLDRLGTPETISETGFPKGGNGLIVLNGELRVALVGGLGAAGFLDAGNVFQRATDLDFGRLRAAAGFGFFYRSPIGPIRLDLGFKLDRRELSPGRLERRSVVHLSFGQAF
jgi:outer membrane protein insertion porin family